MTKSAIITKFHLFMDDSSELSSSEESDLFDKVYSEICDEMPWEFTRKAFAGTQSTTVPYVALPADFAYILNNRRYTDDYNENDSPVVFVSSAYTPYKIINFADRRQYLNQNGYAYIDIVNNLLVFTAQPTTAQSVEFDYCATPTSLALTDSPAFPSRYHDIIYHYMCIDAFILTQSDKAKSYAAENKARGDAFMQRMKFWNAQLIRLN